MADDRKRRDFLLYSAGAGAFTVTAGAWYLLRSSGPVGSHDTSLYVDVSALEPGTQISVLFEGKPIFIYRRTAEDIAAARAVALEDLPDQDGRNANRPRADASDENRTILPFEGEDQGEWLVMVGVCTHMRSVLSGAGAGDFNGWFCTTHGAHFDTAGRVRRGPAGYNMWIPHAEFSDPTTLRVVSLDRSSPDITPWDI